MALPVNIDDLLSGQVVEWDRLEFKEGWNPEDALHTVCAFANDFHNWGGGYLVIGIAEQDGKPILPPAGITPVQADQVQKKLLEFGHKIQPSYHPICEPVTFQDKLILVVWVSGGEMRPYKAPVFLGKDNKDYGYYIRLNSNTVRAQGEHETELISLANNIPFDDRQNQQAGLSDLKPLFIQGFLEKVNSDLAKEAKGLDVGQLGKRMQIVRGPEENLRPLNVGLLFFNAEPEKWFPQTRIDVVELPDGAGGDRLAEKTFTGPLDSMLNSALQYLRNKVITKYTVKHPDRAEAASYYKVPFAAVEEALVNAVYHRSYEEREPIEVRITPDELTILSFPGPDRSVDMDQLRQGRAVSRRYRNRRIGEFLKELDLTEGRSTGIPKILRAMKDNGSPEPQFETDPDRTSFLVRLPLRSAPPSKTRLGTKSVPSLSQVCPKSLDEEVVLKILRASREPVKLVDLMKETRETNRSRFRVSYIEPLIEANLINLTLPDSPNSSKQKYKILELGRKILDGAEEEQ